MLQNFVQLKFSFAPSLLLEEQIFLTIFLSETNLFVKELIFSSEFIVFKFKKSKIPTINRFTAF